jgi:protein-S-isoprenylcysteine O-methyltransferase Ste14
VSEPPADEGTRLPSLGPRGEGWFLLQVVLFVAIVIAGYVANTHWSGAPRFAVSVAGVTLIVAGLALLFFGIRDLDRSLSPMPRPTETSVLIQDGVYRRLRHPIYAGLIVAAIGYSLLMASWVALALAVLLALILDLKARREEAWLRERYPGYAEYAAHTKRFVPGLY